MSGGMSHPSPCRFSQRMHAASPITTSSANLRPIELRGGDAVPLVLTAVVPITDQFLLTPRWHAQTGSNLGDLLVIDGGFDPELCW
jgi:hypothetical protein